ncbi:MAG: FGGY-family carbohydrate kinase [Spirochaetaceae bacterium]|jgi:sugar (pentulose or hexulose) kinase|nr:FGGY-family carbohydrate kinase [Spirochaetaceae bacterium]
MEQHLLCVDIGTSSLKAALIGDEGSIFASCRIGFPRQGSTDAAVYWFEAFCDAAHRLSAAGTELAGTGAAGLAAGIVISGNGPTVTAVSEREPESNLCPYTLLWNVPAEVPSQGSSTSLFIPRFNLLSKLAPEQWNAARYILSGPEYLIWRLTGTAVTILPEERFRPAYWTDAALAENGIDRDRLPPFVPPGFRAGHLTAEAAEALGLPQKVPVYCGAPDWIAALIGTDTLSPGRACDRAGTSEGLNVCVPAPLTAQDIRTLPSIIPGLFNAGYLLPSTGKRFSDYRRSSRFRDISPEESMKLIRTSQEESEERRLVNGIAFEVRQGTEALRKAGADFAALRLSGGQARNAPWNQLKADVLGIPLELTGSPDGELIGDAVIGFTGMGRFGSIAEGAGKLVSVSQVFHPDAKAHARYSGLYQQWLEAGETGIPPRENR